MCPPSARCNRSLPASEDAFQPRRVASHPSISAPSGPSDAPAAEACARRTRVTAVARSRVRASSNMRAQSSCQGASRVHASSAMPGRSPAGRPRAHCTTCARLDSDPFAASRTTRCDQRARGANAGSSTRTRASHTSVVGTSAAQSASTQLATRAHRAPPTRSVTRSEQTTVPLPGVQTAETDASRSSSPSGSRPTTMARAGTP